MPRIVSLFRSRSFKIALAFILFVAATLIILAMMLGNEAGQFVIRVQSGTVDKSIAISDSEDFLDRNNQKSTLVVSGIDNMYDYSPGYFLESGYKKLNEYANTLGVNIVDGSLYVYTFYIVNTSGAGSAVGVNVSLSYSNVTNHCDEIVRVLTYYQSYNVSDPNVYQKHDDLEKLGLSEAPFYDEYILQPIEFANSSDPTGGVVFDNQAIHIGAGLNQNFVKYSIFFWLEGNDPDSEYYENGSLNDLFGGTIKFKLDITVDMAV